jgi:hypothetical protein
MILKIKENPCIHYVDVKDKYNSSLPSPEFCIYTSIHAYALAFYITLHFRVGFYDASIDFLN